MSRQRSPSGIAGFTILEVLVSTVITVMLVVLLVSVIGQASNLWRHTTGGIEQFSQAREAFDTITRRLSDATLNTYWDYDSPTAPKNYVRQSELRFASGPTETISGTPPSGTRWPTHGLFFQATLGASEPGNTMLSGLYSLLNTWGYFIEYGNDSLYRPSILAGSTVPLSYRFRLCEMAQPTDQLSIYQFTSGTDSSGNLKNLSYTGNDWFYPAISGTTSARPVHVLADNVIALVFMPKLSTQDDSTGVALISGTAPGQPGPYIYNSTAAVSVAKLNSKNQLPPLVELAMVAIDEASALRLSGSTMPDLGYGSLFQNPGNLQADLDTLGSTLTARHLSFRIFTTTVRLKEAKWSADEQY